MKILLFIILATVIIGVFPTAVRAIVMARLKYKLRRSRDAVVIIAGPDKEGTKVTIAYPKEASSEAREAVKKIIETSSKARLQS